MAVRTLDLTVSLESILRENSSTLGRLQSHPLAAPLAGAFDAFQITWEQTSSARNALVIAASKAEGAVSAADDALDDFIDLLDRVLLIVVKNDRQNPLYQFYFGLHRPSELKRPILGAELATVRKWIPSIKASSDPTVTPLGAKLQTLVDTADTAVAARAAADEALKSFDEIGPKRALVDSYNTLRVDTYGKLAQLPHTNPAAVLPTTFGDRFFLHDKARTPAAAKQDPEAIKAKIEVHQAAIEALEQDLETATSATEKHAAAKAAAEKSKADLAQAKLDEKANKKKIKELKVQAKSDAKKAKKPKGKKH